VELSARASKIGVGAPAGFAPALCSGALRADPFSQKLNYYVGTTLTNTRLFGLPIQPTLTVYSERRGEPFAYLRETGVGALIELSRQFTARTSGTAGVQYENGRTIRKPTPPVTSTPTTTASRRLYRHNPTIPAAATTTAIRL
jgi:outer membrane protein insertion porin family/translocation and assembly module TamA